MKWAILFRHRNKEVGRSSFKHYYVRCPTHGDLFCVGKGKAMPHWMRLGLKEVEIAENDESDTQGDINTNTAKGLV